MYILHISEKRTMAFQKDPMPSHLAGREPLAYGKRWLLVHLMIGMNKTSKLLESVSIVWA